MVRAVGVIISTSAITYRFLLQSKIANDSKLFAREFTTTNLTKLSVRRDYVKKIIKKSLLYTLNASEIKKMADQSFC